MCQLKSRPVCYPILLVLFLLVGIPPGCNQKKPTGTSDIVVDIEENLQRLLAEEDTDGDKKITIDDHVAGNSCGDKIFRVVGEDGTRREINGTYHLSNLLQELKLLEGEGVETGRLEYEKLYENPVNRISRCIRELYWEGLTRRLDEAHIADMLPDSKTDTVDGCGYLYVPYHDEIAFDYFFEISRNVPGLRMKVMRLPEVVTPEWVRSRDGYHGVLSLALIKSEDGNQRGVPFVVPGGRFNEMYGWDSYFEVLGLLEDGFVSLAKAMVDNFVYEREHYGKILNANRSYYLTRSQPPFLTSMALAVFDCLPETSESEEWLAGALEAAIGEYREVWTAPPRLTDTGLSRYFGEGTGPPPEVEPGHFNAVYSRYAGKYGMSAEEFEKAYINGEATEPELDRFFVHDRSMRESGHDTTYRWDDRCADFVTVDLNSLLYKIERDIARTIREVFGDSLVLQDGTVETSAPWYSRAEKRKRLMNNYLWDENHGLYLDYDCVNECRRVYLSATALYPLWAGLASPEQAAFIVASSVPALEMAGGIAASTEDSRGPLSETRPQRQWDYPYGWAPHQMLAWKGLENYGYDDIAFRLVYRWLYTITRNAADYNGTIPEKFDVVNRSHRVFAEYGNVGTDFSYITREGFGWMNASYQVGLKRLPPELRRQLEDLVPPERVFERQQ